MYTYVPARHFRAEYKRVYVYASLSLSLHTRICINARPVPARTGTTYLRIITYKRVILSYTPALLMIIKTPRSILFALEYFLKFSPDNGAIRVSGPTAPPDSPSPVSFSSSYTVRLCAARTEILLLRGLRR